MVALGNLCESFAVFWNSKHYSSILNKLNIGVKIAFAPNVCPKVQNFLRSACALDWQRGFSKNGFSSSKWFTQFCSLLRVIVIINWANFWFGIIQQFFKSLNFAPVILETCWYNQVVVCELSSFIGQNQIFLGFNFRYAFLCPNSAFWNDFFHCSSCIFSVSKVVSDHSPSRLVVVIGWWIKNSDFGTSDVFLPQKLRCYIDTACSSTQDTKFAMSRIPIRNPDDFVKHRIFVNFNEVSGFFLININIKFNWDSLAKKMIFLIESFN